MLDDCLEKKALEWANNTSQYPLKYLWTDPDIDESVQQVECMQFRLVYEGSLKASTGKNPHVAEKHAIRKQIHKQLAELWRTHYALKAMSLPLQYPSNGAFGVPICPVGTSVQEVLAAVYERNGYRFIPLINVNFDLMCSLDILFLRRENPGDLILRGGDVDNRIKTLLDALRMPDNGSELVGLPEPNENPFYCLLQNDSLVTELNITTDRLLKPLEITQHPNEVVLVIKVVVKGSKATLGNLELVG